MAPTDPFEPKPRDRSDDDCCNNQPQTSSVPTHRRFDTFPVFPNARTREPIHAPEPSTMRARSYQGDQERNRRTTLLGLRGGTCATANRGRDDVPLRVPFVERLDVGRDERRVLDPDDELRDLDKWVFWSPCSGG